MNRNDRHGKKGGSRGGGGPRRAAPTVRRGTFRLKHEVARRVRAGHPWIYREALGRKLHEEPGTRVEFVDWDGEFVGRGVVDGETAIAIRVMTRSPSEHIGAELVHRRVKSAIDLRRRFLDFEEQESMRLVNAESDGLPAIAVERYGPYLVTQIYSGAMVEALEPLYDALEAELSPTSIYEQRRFKSLGGDAPTGGATLVRGSVAPVEVEVKEGPLRFHADVTAPLSTGLFADLREGRASVAKWSAGRRVLNLFSYTGAISVYAAHGGASEVCAVDVSAKAHARARKNFALSGFDAETPEHIVGDAFKVMAKFADRKRSFDLVVIDPPAFASASRGGKAWSALKDYGELVAAALEVLAPGGLIAAACSTHKMSHQDFDTALAEGARKAAAELRIVERRGLPIDFPVAPGFPEGNYLKFAVAARD